MSKLLSTFLRDLTAHHARELLYRPKIFIYFSDFFDVMALKVSCEFVAEAVYKVVISCEKAVVRDLCITAASLYGIYTTSKLVARAIDGIVNRGLGGPRKDQGITDSTQRLHTSAISSISTTL
jgi:hypothetical protein